MKNLTGDGKLWASDKRAAVIVSMVTKETSTLITRKKKKKEPEEEGSMQEKRQGDLSTNTNLPIRVYRAERLIPGF